MHTTFGVHGASKRNSEILDKKENPGIIDNIWFSGQRFVSRDLADAFSTLSKGKIQLKFYDPDYASHGCIRLSNKNIEYLYGLTILGTDTSGGTKIKIINEKYEDYLKNQQLTSK